MNCRYKSIAYEELRIYRNSQEPYNSEAVKQYEKLGCYSACKPICPVFQENRDNDCLDDVIEDEFDIPGYLRG